jgi:tetratricopeptide (TPR) repeat protein
MRADSYEALDRAILFFERALTLDPDYIRAQVELGYAWAQKGEYLSAPEFYERGITILRRTLEARPRLPRAWRELGVALVAAGRVDEGLEALRRAFSLAPEDPRVLSGLARGYFIGKADFKKAAELFAKAVERNPEAGWYLMQLAHCHALLREFAPGEQAARRAIELQEAFLSGQQGVQLMGAYMRLGHLLALQGRHQEATEAFASEMAFSERMDHALRSRIRVELYMRRGESLLALGEEKQAEASFTAGLTAFAARVRLGAIEPFSRYYAAAIHAQRNARDDALTLLAGAVAVSPAFMIARCRIEPEWVSLRDDPRFRELLQPGGSG